MRYRRARTGCSPADWMIAAARLSERRLGSWVGRGVRTGVAACQAAAHWSGRWPGDSYHESTLQVVSGSRCGWSC